MGLKIERINEANAIASGTIPLKVVDERFEEISKKYARMASIKGFRKGKIPLSVVKKRFGSQIQQEVEQEVVRTSFQEVLRDLELSEDKILGNPSITKFEKTNQEICIEFKISMTPKIDLSKLKSCIPNVEIKEPSLKEINKRIGDIARENAPLVKVRATTKLAKEHVANIDFEGSIDGKTFDGGKAEGFDLLIGSGQFIPGFEDQLLGMKKGEEREIEINFPVDYPVKDLANRISTFRVKLNEIRIKDQLKIDDELAKRLLKQEDATLTKLKEQVKLQLINETKSKAYNQELKPKTVEGILRAVDFDLPDLIVEQEINILLNNYARTLSQEQLEVFQKDSKMIEKKRKEFENEARRSVKITFIVDCASKELGLQVQDNEVIQAIHYEAMMAGQDPRQMLEFYQKNNLLPAVKMAILEDRFLTMLLDEKHESMLSQKNTEAKSKKPATEKINKSRASEDKPRKNRAKKENG